MSTQMLSLHRHDDLYVSRISPVVNDLMTKEEVFRENLHQTHVITQLTDLMEVFSPEEFLAIEEHELRQQVGKFMANQLVQGLFDSENLLEPLNGPNMVNIA
jgi:hypothetical protein